jgi:hypothetical protein
VHLLQHRLRHAAEHLLAPAIMTVGAHHKQCAAERLGLAEQDVADRLTRCRLVPTSVVPGANTLLNSMKPPCLVSRASRAKLVHTSPVAAYN